MIFVARASGKESEGWRHDSRPWDLMTERILGMSASKAHFASVML